MSANTIQTPVKVDLRQVDKSNNTSTKQYQYNYATSNTVVTKHDTYIKFDFDSKDAEIKFGDVSYKVEEVRLYRGSLTEYEGANVAAELIIHHIESDAEQDLFVHIPIVFKQNTVGDVNNYLENTIKHIESTSDKQTISGQTLELNDFIKERPFFLWSSGNNHRIFFSPTNHAIYIHKSVKEELEQLLDEPNVSHTPLDDSLILYNNTGSINLSKSDPDSDDIYIDCSPTGDTLIPLDELQQEEGVQPDLPFTERVRKFFQDNPWAITVLEVIGSFIGFIIAYYVYKLFRKGFKAAEDAAVEEDKSLK